MAKKKTIRETTNADQARQLSEQYRRDIQQAADAMKRTMRVRRACVADVQQHTYTRIF